MFNPVIPKFTYAHITICVASEVCYKRHKEGMLWRSVSTFIVGYHTRYRYVFFPLTTFALDRKAKQMSSLCIVNGQMRTVTDSVAIAATL